MLFLFYFLLIFPSFFTSFPACFPWSGPAVPMRKTKQTPSIYNFLLSLKETQYIKHFTMLIHAPPLHTSTCVSSGSSTFGLAAVAFTALGLLSERGLTHCVKSPRPWGSQHKAIWKDGSHLSRRCLWRMTTCRHGGSGRLLFVAAEWDEQLPTMKAPSSKLPMSTRGS